MRSVPTLVLRDMARCTIAWMKLSCLKRQFEVVKCLFLGWNHLWCFRVLSLFVFRVCLLRSLWYPQLKLTADLPSISRRGMWINIYHFRPCLLVENYSNYIHAMSWMNRVILRLLVPSKS